MRNASWTEELAGATDSELPGTARPRATLDSPRAALERVTVFVPRHYEDAFDLGLTTISSSADHAFRI